MADIFKREGGRRKINLDLSNLRGPIFKQKVGIDEPDERSKVFIPHGFMEEGLAKIGESKYKREPSQTRYVFGEGMTALNRLADYANKILGFISVTGIGLGAFLLSGNITGNVIYNLQRYDANATGLILVFAGIFGLMFSMNSKN